MRIIRSNSGQATHILHASCVDLNGHGVLILGASGSGKSALSLELMALGARLVADDRTEVRADGDDVYATCPASIRGMIEARGVGLLRAETTAASKIALVIDLDVPETERLPEQHTITIDDVALPLLRKIAAPHFPAAILQYLRAGRIESA